MLRVHDGVARFEELSLPHGFSTKGLGNMSSSWGPEDEVNRNAEAFYTKTGLNRESRVHMLPQHGTKVVFVDNDNAGQTIECDCLATRSPGLTLSVCPADCLPIIIKGADEHSLFVALIHAGWKGTRDGIMREALDQLLLNRFLYSESLDELSLYSGSSCEPLMAYIGPGVGSCCYKPSFVSKRLGAKTDLVSENTRQLLECGVKEENIIIANSCTYCSKDENGNNLFFSHQRSKRTKEREGRFAAIVALPKIESKAKELRFPK